MIVIYGTEKLIDALERLSAVTKKELGDLLYQEGRLLCVDLAKYTQPFGLQNDARQKSENKIEKDYLKVYPDPLSIEQRIKKIDAKNAEKVFDRLSLYLVSDAEKAAKMLKDLKYKEPTKNADPSYHKKRWVKGRIVSGDSQIVINRKSIDTMISQAASKIGFAKSGWATCANQLGGTRGIPAWVTRQKAPGEVVNKTKEKNPSLTLINKINYTTQVLSDDAKTKAINDRVLKLTERFNQAILR